ncbi:MAG: DUF996 domain-containing protein [Candidatus Bathyarchaeia archaeon]
MTLDSSKALGGIGAILLFIGAITFFVEPFLAILGLIGIILVLVALHDLANNYKEGGIFKNALFSFIAGIVGLVVTGITVVYLFFYTTILTDFLHVIYPTWNGDLSTLTGLTPDTSNITTSNSAPLLEAFFLALAVLWIFSIITAFFARRSLKVLSAKASVGLFSTAALLLLIGGFLTIVFIGFILMLIAVLLIAIAFFQIKPQPEQPVATVVPSPSMPTPV